MKSNSEWLNDLEVVLHHAKWEQKEREAQRRNKIYGKIKPATYVSRTILLGWPFFLRIYEQSGELFGLVWVTNRLTRNHHPSPPHFWALADVRMPGRSASEATSLR